MRQYAYILGNFLPLFMSYVGFCYYFAPRALFVYGGGNKLRVLSIQHKILRLFVLCCYVVELYCYCNMSSLLILFDMLYNLSMSKKLSKNSIKIVEWPATQKAPKVLRTDGGKLLPGQVLNPTGLKKGTRHFATLMKEAIKKVAEGTGTTYDVAIIQKHMDKALRGDTRSFEIILDRVDGKPLQEIDLTSGGETIGMSPEQRAKLDELLSQA
jgi:hypothetical protein